MKQINIDRRFKRDLRHKRVTNRLKADQNDKPRLVVTKTNANIYAQIIDDAKGHTLVYLSSLMLNKPGNVKTAEIIGTKVAEEALKQEITQVAFDRGGNKYHGQIKALADAARVAGLKI
jgi:large subunit ribosomal protein L18